LGQTEFRINTKENMNKIIKKLLLAVLIVTQTSPAQPVTLARSTVIGGAVVGGVASGAVGYGIFTVLEKLYDKSRKGIALSAQDRALGKQVLKEIGEELAQEDNQEDTSSKAGRSMKRTVLMSIFVLTTAILGGGLTFQFLDGYTNVGRLKYAEEVMGKIDRDELLALIAGNEDWHEDDEVLNQIYIKFGAKAPMTQLKKYVDAQLEQVAKAGNGLKKIHADKSRDLDDNTGIDELDEKTQEKLTVLRGASDFLAKSPNIMREAFARQEASDNTRRTISNVRKIGSVARGAVRLGRTVLA